MTEQQETPEAQGSPAAGPPPVSRGEWREQRRAQREARREGRAESRQHRSRRSGQVWGCILILLGIVFFLQNAGMPVTLNWWAVFALIPAFWTLLRVLDSYRAQGRLTRRAAGSAVGGILVTLVALILLFNVDFSNLWPLLLVVAGASLLLTALIPE